VSSAAANPLLPRLFFFFYSPPIYAENDSETSNEASQHQGAGQGGARHGPSDPDHLGLVVERLPRRGDQVADAVEDVEGEGPGYEELGSDLNGQRQGAKGRGDADRRQVPAQDGRGEVSGGKQVQTARQHDACVALHRRAHRVDLPFVDAQVRRHRPVQPLAREVPLALLGRLDLESNRHGRLRVRSMANSTPQGSRQRKAVTNIVRAVVRTYRI
jgi:hypothetical protein